MKIKKFLKKLVKIYKLSDDFEKLDESKVLEDSDLETKIIADLKKSKKNVIEINEEKKKVKLVVA